MVNSDAPGLKRKDNKDGSVRNYWEARSDIAKRGYRPKLVRLHYPDTDDGRRQMAARCRILQAEMLAWQSNDGAFKPRAYDGTIGALCRQFLTDADSPYRGCKYNSQIKYDKDTKIIINTVGGRRVDSLLGPDFRRWHANWGAPKEEGSPPRPWRAKHCIDSTRRVIGYGVTLGFEDCIRADIILSKMEFRQPPARNEKMTFEHVGAIRRTGHEMGYHSVSLATVCQFELSLRQKDVIGEWIPEGETAGGVSYRGRQWRNGLTWSDIRPDGYLRKAHTKTGQVVEWNLNLYPAVLEELNMVSADRRVGPLIISESTGQPYKFAKFSEAFRRVANRAGIPRGVWSMDARAGAISEAYDAGATETDVMKHAGHRNRQTSARYNRGSLKQTERVAVLRHQKRGENEG